MNSPTFYSVTLFHTKGHKIALKGTQVIPIKIMIGESKKKHKTKTTKREVMTQKLNIRFLRKLSQLALFQLLE